MEHAEVLIIIIIIIIRAHDYALAHFIAKIRPPEVNIWHSTSALFVCFVQAKAT